MSVLPLTGAQLVQVMPTARGRIARWVAPLNAAMQEFEVHTVRRVTGFLANIAHESGELRYVRELGSGAAYDTGRLAARLGNTPAADGDGQRYKGRGPGQLTGADNYRRCGVALGLDLLAHPELLEQPVHGARAFAWFWQSTGLNELMDQNDFAGVCGVINTGIRATPPTRIRGYDARLAYFERAKQMLDPGGPRLRLDYTLGD